MRFLIAASLFALASVEGLAYWWMHPARAAQDQRVLTWHPQQGQHRRTAPTVGSGVNRESEESAGNDNRAATEQSASEPPISGFQRFGVSAFTYSPLPEVYANAAPMLRCSSGQVCSAKADDSLSLHLAFFAWDHTDTGSVLEAFRHLPEVCMGSIGMKLIAEEPPVTYHVDGIPVTFDHTVFREPGQGGGLGLAAPLVHAFRAVWVADLPGADARQGLMGKSLDQLRGIRLRCALTRYRPAHARVIQGAVYGAANSAAAWQAFETAMLSTLTWQAPAKS